MKKAEVTIGRAYRVQRDGVRQDVRVEEHSVFGGWYCRDLRTRQVVRVTSAQRFRRALTVAEEALAIHEAAR